LAVSRGTYVYIQWWVYFEENPLFGTKCAILHEICHLYAAIDLYNATIYPNIEAVIMDGAETWDNKYESVRIHPITFDWIVQYEIKFDGVKDSKSLYFPSFSVIIFIKP